MENLAKIIDMFCIRSSRLSLYFIVFIVFILSLFDMLGLTIFYPITQAIISPDTISESKVYHLLSILFNFDGFGSFINILLIIASAFFLTKFILSFLVNHHKFNKIYDGQITAANIVFAKYLNVNLQFFKNNSNHSLIKIINTDLMLAYNQVVFNFISLCSDLILLTVFIFLVALININLFLILIFSILLFSVLFLIKSIRSQAKKNKQPTYSEIQTKMAELVTESISNYMITKIKSLEPSYIKAFQLDSEIYKQSYISFRSKHESPKYILEFIFGIALTLTLFILMISSKNVISIIPVFSLVILSLFRVLPCVSKIASSFYSIKFYMPSVIASHKYLFSSLSFEAVNSNLEPVTDINSVNVNNVSFTYGERVILNNITLKAQSGDHVFIIGETGSGKSTLVNIILGLLTPASGFIELNGNPIERLYQSCSHLIAYVPQVLYFSNVTVAKAISHRETSDLNYEFMKFCMEMACIPISSACFPDGFMTIIGEDGSLLSGGEKQRLAIARALYSKPQLLILDEATSAVDIHTQSKIIENLSSLNSSQIIISITHKITTIDNNCKVYKMDNNSIIEILSDKRRENNILF